MRKRLKFPYEHLWVDEDKRIHRCKWLVDSKDVRNENMGCPCGCSSVFDDRVPKDLYELLAIIRATK